MIIRKAKKKNYTCIDNTILKNKEITARSKGIFCYLLTLPDDWKIYKSEIYNHFSEGRKAIDRCFRELESHGYIIKKRVKEKGKFVGWNYTITEIPFSVQSENRQSENRQVGKVQLLSTNELSTNLILNTNKEKENDINYNLNQIFRDSDPMPI